MIYMGNKRHNKTFLYSIKIFSIYVDLEIFVLYGETLDVA